jgi:hypothetical protein
MKAKQSAEQFSYISPKKRESLASTFLHAPASTRFNPVCSAESSSDGEHV